MRSQEPIPSVGDDRKCHEGTFVGVDQRAGQYMIHGSGVIKVARTIMRMPEPDKFNKEELAKIAVTPWDMHVPREMEVVFKDKSEGAQEVAKDEVTLSR